MLVEAARAAISHEARYPVWTWDPKCVAFHGVLLRYFDGGPGAGRERLVEINKRKGWGLEYEPINRMRLRYVPHTPATFS